MEPGTPGLSEASRSQRVKWAEPRAGQRQRGSRVGDGWAEVAPTPLHPRSSHGLKGPLALWLPLASDHCISGEAMVAATGEPGWGGAG